MFSNKRIMTSTENSSDNIQRFHELLQKIDTIIIGAGLSTLAGLLVLVGAIKMADYIVREMMGL